MENNFSLHCKVIQGQNSILILKILTLDSMLDWIPDSWFYARLNSSTVSCSRGFHCPDPTPRRWPAPWKRSEPADTNSHTSTCPYIFAHALFFTSLSNNYFPLPVLSPLPGPPSFLRASSFFLSVFYIILSLCREFFPLPSNICRSPIPLLKAHFFDAAASSD